MRTLTVVSRKDGSGKTTVADAGIEAEIGAASAPALSPEDTALDAQWRAAFGQPLPLLGAGPIVRTILAEKASASGRPGSSRR
jgi:hypothetical protein